MTSAPLVPLPEPDDLVVSVMTGIEPNLAEEVVRQAVADAAASQAKRRRLARALADDPDLLTSGRPEGPAVIGEFVRALLAHGSVRAVLLKASLLDGRILRSHSIDGIDQEVWALLATYQALIRAASDAVAHRPDLDMDRLSFTVLLQTAADTVVTGHGIATGKVDLVGAIGTAALAHLWPARRRHRVKARSIKNSTEIRPQRWQTPPERQTLHRPHRDHVHGERTRLPVPTLAGDGRAAGGEACPGAGVVGG
ncbi:hypothetical protein QCN29_35835 [Streptomyces sp. HNM0663]|uniref:Uncharacterized protein n=1 Tax=Streptomyces chengmaiensis TaxID=3040919 RepID=A0ABT6I043_9ACTN|nr:hypothetical protein [Streptomyces chengmaiensis]MDH2394022.1 hypothetical protein [Streptomyces chengmaiensis]